MGYWFWRVLKNNIYIFILSNWNSFQYEIDPINGDFILDLMRKSIHGGVKLWVVVLAHIVLGTKIWVMH